MSKASEVKTEEVSNIKRGLLIPPLPSTMRGFGIHLGSRTNKVPCISYGAQNTCVLRAINEAKYPLWCTLNNVHSTRVNVVKFAPNGEWVVSGDNGGQVYVWAHESFVVKNQIVVGKQVTDIAYDSEGKRIAAVGKGKDDKGKVFPWNTNNKLGELTGCSKGFLSVDFKPNRPFRVVCGAEDNAVYCYKGPPFKFETYGKVHKGYANCVRYHPSGKEYISVGSDKKLYKWDGKTGKKCGEIVDKKNAHKGTIYSLSFNKDGSKFITSSADKSCKIWDYATGKVLNTIVMGKEIMDMQVSCIWTGDDKLYSVSLSGNINILAQDKKKPTKVLVGHKESVQCIAVDRINGFIFSGDIDSKILRVNIKTGACVDYRNKKAHSDQSLKFVKVDCKGKTFYTVGVDDRIVRTNIIQECKHDNGVTLLLNENGTKMDGATKCIAVSRNNPDLVVLGTHKQKLCILSGIELKKTTDIDYTPTAIDISPDDKEICVAGDDSTVRFYKLDDMKECGKIACTNKYYFTNQFVNYIAYSPDGKLIATTDKNRNIWVWKRDDLKKPFNSKDNQSYRFHVSTPYCVDWSPDGKTLISCGNDGQLIYWTNVSTGDDYNETLERAFFSSIKGAYFMNDKTVVAGGGDATIRVFHVPYKGKVWKGPSNDDDEETKQND